MAVCPGNTDHSCLAEVLLLWEDEGVGGQYLDRLQCQDENMLLNTAENGKLLRIFVRE